MATYLEVFSHSGEIDEGMYSVVRQDGRVADAYTATPIVRVLTILYTELT